MINSNKTLVACLDILGYRDIVARGTPETVYDFGVAIFRDLHILVSKISPEQATTQEDLQKQCSSDILKAIKYHIMSDTIIMYLDCNDVERINESYFLEVDHDYSALVHYISTVATFILLFTYHTGCLLRGGISIGKFYRKSFDVTLLDGDLIFSEAFVRSYELEQSAVYPRALIDDQLLSLWNDKLQISQNIEAVKSLLKQDADGKWYIDSYQAIYAHDSDTKKQWLNPIMCRIKEMLDEKKNQEAILKKWLWFKDYHNLKISGFIKDQGQDLNELMI